MSEVEKISEKQAGAAAQPADNALTAEALELLGNGTLIARGSDTDPAPLETNFAQDVKIQPGKESPFYSPGRQVPTVKWYQTHPGVFAPPTDCKPSRTYNELMAKSVRNLYDPSPLAKVPDLNNKYNCLIESDADAIKYANEALKVTGDPYNVVYTPVEAAAIEKAQQGKRGDIGVGLKSVDGKIVVEQAPNGTEADLKVGDVITHVNGEDLSKRTHVEAQQRITGSDATTVSVKVIRDGKALELEVSRTEVEVASVRDKMLPGDVLYLRLDNMDSQKQAREMKEAIERNPTASSYIIDLRNNPGGLLSNSFELASLFLDKGNLLTVTRRVESEPNDPKFKSTHYVLTPDGIVATPSLEPGTKPDSQIARHARIVDKPVVVLVNGRSASAAEILAVSLQENGAATVIGEQTFGKGVGQSLYQKMPGGSALKLTTFRFFTPKGNWLGDGVNTRNGVTPDIKVNNYPGVAFGSPADGQLNAAQQYLRVQRGG